MRRSLLGLSLLAAACGGGDDTIIHPTVTHADVQAFSTWNVDVATLRTVGDVPPAQRTVTLFVDVDGELTVDGESLDLAGLRAVLRERTGAREPSELDAVLALDKTLPWKVAQILMQECASVQIGRIFFAVRHVGGETGTIATFLPVDRSVMDFGTVKERPKLVVKVRASGEPSDPLGLVAVPARIEDDGFASAFVEVDAAASTPVGLVLEIVDAAAIWRARDLTLVGAPPPADEVDLAGVVAALRSEPTARSIAVSGEPLSAPPSDVRVPPRTMGAYAGFAAHPGSWVEMEEEIELVEPDER